MTIGTQTSSVTDLGNGSTTAFTYPFLMPAASDAVVTYTDTSGNQVVLSATQYTITGIGSTTGGTVTYPLSGSPIASGASLTIARALPLIQGTSLSNQGPTFASIEGALDYLTMLVQQVNNEAERAIVINPADINLPTPLPVASVRANQWLYFDSQGNPTAASAVSGSVAVSAAMQPVVAAATTAAATVLLNYLQSYTGAVTRGLNSKLGDILSAADFGAVPDGATDNTSALQAWLNEILASGKAGYLPGGTAAYNVSGALSIGSGSGVVKIYGDGALQSTGGSIICSTSGTADILDVNLWQFTCEDIGFDCSTTRTAGDHLGMQGQNANLSRVSFHNYFVGLNAAQNVGGWRDLTFSDPVVSTGVGIRINGYAGGLAIDNALFFAAGADTQPAAGIQILACSGLLLSNSNIIQQGIDLEIAPSNGAQVDSIFCCNTWFDTATTGVSINSTGTGSAVRLKFVQCWSSSHSGNGFVINNTGSGTVGGIELIGHTAIDNTDSGLSIVAGADVKVIGGLYAANGGAGVLVAAGVNNFSIIGATCGESGGLSGNAENGITVSSGSSNNYIIANNQCTGNTGTSIADAGTGTSKFVQGNIGYNPVAPGTVTVGASPFTWTNGLGSPAVLAISGGTVSEVTLDGFAVAAATNTSVTVPQGQSAVITYSVKPTVVSLPL